MTIRENDKLQGDIALLRTRLRKHAYVVVCAATLLLGILLFAALGQVNTVINNELRDTIASGLLENAESTTAEHLHAVSEYAALLRDTPGISAFLSDPSDPEKASHIRSHFFSTASVIGTLQQIRLIDLNGKEIIRVDHDGKETWITPDEELQDKSDRYFVTEGLQLEFGELYFSAIDVNIEHGRMDPTEIWTLRVVTPVADLEGQTKALLVINYEIDELLRALTNLTDGIDTMLYDARSGVWIFRTDLEVSPILNFNAIGDETSLTSGSSVEELFFADIKRGMDHGTVNDDERTHLSYARIAVGTSAEADMSPRLFLPRAVYKTHFSEYKPDDYALYIVTRTNASFLEREIGFLSTAVSGIIISFLALVLVSGLLLARAYASRRAAELWAIRLKSVFALMNKTMRHDLAGKLTNVKYGIEASGIEGNQAIDLAYASAQGGVELIHQMKQLEQMVEEGVSLLPMPLRSTIEDVVAKYALPITIEGDDIHVLADPSLASVFDNLIRNAIAHSGTDKMEIVIRHNEDEVYVTVSDFGKGIPKKVQKDVFAEGFKYGETANTGLGLYIVDQVIQRYGGSVKYRDTIPKGATFVLRMRKA